ncbi:GTPase activating protein (GAP) for Rho1p [Malassezia sp. CBS 17886]|nr:GTPase activating protein (GAP) for Rho1p [Malassezia sp. CBS 17886]
MSSQDDPNPALAGLRSWWSSFARVVPLQREGRAASDPGVFGAPLSRALRLASVAISLADGNGEPHVWGYVPIVVARLGLFVKQNASDVEGIFRISGSERRMADLQAAFDTPPGYGRDVDWAPYTVHDAAGLLRRYLTMMPEPVIPFDMYQDFRNVAAKPPPSADAAIKSYRPLITSCPPAHQYLLLYLLDLLAVFARKSDTNRMTAHNLAIVFQPSLLMHPSQPSIEEHQLAVRVIEFLIEHQDRFVLAPSASPAPKGAPENLTNASHPFVDDYRMDPSDSDEELGVVEAHVGGGARLARVTASPRTRERGARKRTEKGATAPHDLSGYRAYVAHDRADVKLPFSPGTTPPKPRRASELSNSSQRPRSSSLTGTARPQRATGRVPARSPLKASSALAPPTTPMRPKLGQRSASATSVMESVSAPHGNVMSPTPASPAPPGKLSPLSPGEGDAQMWLSGRRSHNASPGAQQSPAAVEPNVLSFFPGSPGEPMPQHASLAAISPRLETPEDTAVHRATLPTVVSASPPLQPTPPSHPIAIPLAPRISVQSSPADAARPLPADVAPPFPLSADAAPPLPAMLSPTDETDTASVFSAPPAVFLGPAGFATGGAANGGAADAARPEAESAGSPGTLDANATGQTCDVPIRNRPILPPITYAMPPRLSRLGPVLSPTDELAQQDTATEKHGGLGLQVPSAGGAWGEPVSDDGMDPKEKEDAGEGHAAEDVHGSHEAHAESEECTHNDQPCPHAVIMRTIGGRRPADKIV